MGYIYKLHCYLYIIFVHVFHLTLVNPVSVIIINTFLKMKRMASRQEKLAQLFRSY